jgi:hypothetical protein
MTRDYQRRYLRAPYRQHVLYADGSDTFRARGLNISEGGLYLDELPGFPRQDEVGLLFPVPQLPILKNFSLLKLQTYSLESCPRRILRARVRMVRRDELAQDLENIFKARVGLEFTHLDPEGQQAVEVYVNTFCSNLVHLQTMIDQFNSDDEIRSKVRQLARILGYHQLDKISQLRAEVEEDYKNLQWL